MPHVPSSFGESLEGVNLRWSRGLPFYDLPLVQRANQVIVAITALSTGCLPKLREVPLAAGSQAQWEKAGSMQQKAALRISYT